MKQLTYLMSLVVLCLCTIAVAEEPQTPAPPPPKVLAKAEVRQRNAKWQFILSKELVSDQDGKAGQEVQMLRTVTDHQPLNAINSLFSGGNSNPFGSTEQVYYTEQPSNIAVLLSAILTQFLEVDIDFPGGDWPQFGNQVRERLLAAYKTQLPEFVATLLPKEIEIELAGSTVSMPQPRFAEIHLKKVPLGSPAGSAGLQLFDCQSDEPPGAGKPWKFVLSPPQVGSWPTAVFFNLAEIPREKNRELKELAADVAALFEIGWTTERPIVFARTKFHQETGMLLVRGTSDEIYIAREAFNALSRKQPNENPFDKIIEGLANLDKTLDKQTDLLDKIKDKQ